MANDPPKILAIREALKQRGNPYAFVDLIDDAPAVPQVMDSERRAAYKLSENPQAFHYYATDAGASVESAQVPAAVGAVAPAHRAQCQLSKADFRSGCHDLFRPYIPAIEKGKLRPHHRAFIDRNATRTPEVRYALLAHLQRYSLADVPGLSSQFNREREDLTETKLIAIERAVGVLK